jgi:hypothetical protein
MDVFDKATQIHPDNSDLWYKKIDLYDKMLELEPDNTELWSNKATVLKIKNVQ